MEPRLSYNLHRQTRKDAKISIDLVNGVVVYAPDKMTDDKIKKLIEQKAKWIHEKLEEINEVQTMVQPKEFVNGEKFPYLDRHYRLKVNRADTDTATIG